MKRSDIQTALIAAALLLGSSTLHAADSRPAAAAESKASGSARVFEQGATAKSAAPKTKHVDINSAGKAQLMKLEGIGEAEAGRIIAGRPYLSKAHLVTRNVIPHATYEKIKRQIVAIQKTAPSKK